MSRRLDDLHPALRPLAFELIARCTEQGICLCIIDTLRTTEEQEENIKKGVSWTKNSKHLPLMTHSGGCPNYDGTTRDRCVESCGFGLSRAIDVCPYEVYQLKGSDKLQWDANDAVWTRIGVIGEGLGLRWGGRWTAKRDMGHFELV